MTNSRVAPRTTSSHTTAFAEALEQVNVQPLWDRYQNMLTPEPQAPDAPMLWSWNTMLPMIERAVQEVPMEDAERRVLLLSNPAFAPNSYTTTNLQAGLQILEPNETAPPHRHTVGALRFVIEGHDATTWVNGKPCPMSTGDLILTPSWCWHEHRNESQHRVIWLDGLDVPLVHGFSTAALQFGEVRDIPEQYSETLSQAGMLPTNIPKQYQHYSPRYHYAADSVAKALQQSPTQADGSQLLRYSNPVTGGPVMPTLDCYALALRKHAQTRAWRSTSNSIAVVVNGSGQSSIGNTTISWQKNDVFSLPHWHWVSHKAETDAQLFLMSDHALLEAAGYLLVQTE